jgi:hypothetical protein
VQRFEEIVGLTQVCAAPEVPTACALVGAMA